MAVINAVSRPVVITIALPNGSSPVVVTPQFISLVTKNSNLDESGIIKTTGTLTLAGVKTVGFSYEMDPRLTPELFSVGNRITVDSIPDSTATLQRHPRGALRILQVPKPPNGGALEIDVGCDFAYYDFPDLPARDVDDTTDTLLYEETTTRSSIINYLIDRTEGLSELSLVDSIPEYPLSLLRVPSLGSESRVAQIGQIAYAAGYVLWMDNERNIRATKIDLEETPTAEYIVGDAIDFEYLIGDEAPAEIVRTRSYNVIMQEIVDPGTIESTTSIAAGLGYSPSEVSTTILSATTTENPSLVQTVLRPAGLLLPDQFPGSPGLTLAQRETKNTYFDLSETGIKLREVQAIEQPLGVSLPQYYPGSLSVGTSSQTTTYYTYEEEATVRVESVKLEPQGVVFSDSTLISSAAALTISETTVEQWIKFAQGWIKRTSFFSNKTGESRVDTSYSNQGGNQPPAPERKQPDQIKVRKTFSSQTPFTQRIGPTGSKRPVDFELPPTITSQEHSDELCVLLGKILYGRSLPCSWQNPVVDHHLGSSYRPFRTYKWTDTRQGKTYWYLADGDAFELASSSLTWAADGLYLGVENEDGSVDPPYRIPLTARVRAIGRVRGDITPSYNFPIISEPARALGRTAGNIAPGFTGTARALGRVLGEFSTTVLPTGTWMHQQENAPELWIYYSASAPPNDLAGLRIAVLLDGVDYDATGAVQASLTDFLQANGTGYYVLAPYESGSEYKYLDYVIIDEPSECVSVTYDIYQDSGNSITDSYAPVFQITNANVVGLVTRLFQGS